MKTIHRAHIRRLYSKIQLVIGFLCLGFISAQAQAINWDSVSGQDVVLFHPGQASWEWCLTQKDHSGAQKFKKGKACKDCHEEEEVDIGELMASGEKAEPQPIEGNIGSVPVNIKFAQDGTSLFARFEWAAPAKIPGKPMDPDFESKLTMMFGDDSIKEAVMAGCWGTCHDDVDSMASSPGKGEELKKYLSKSRTKSGRTGGGTNYKTDEQLDALMADTYFLEYWQARLNPGTESSAVDGHILSDRIEHETPLVNMESSFNDGKWSVVLSRPLKAGNPQYHDLVEGMTYNVGFALHDNHKSQRFHNVSFEYTLVLDAGEADFVVVKQ
jgi:cytochrome c-type protein NapC